MTRTANATYPMKIECLIRIAADSGHPFICPECDKPILPAHKIEFDHGWAVGRGGPNTADALAPVHALPKGDAAGLDCHYRKTHRPRGPHIGIGGDNFEAKRTTRLADKMVPQKRPLDLILATGEGRCRRCGQDPCTCQAQPRRSAFSGGRR